jgi:VIT1/CCC1 family predicted Fe2+/Mn2+ transporter
LDDPTLHGPREPHETRDEWEEQHPHRGAWLRELVFGANDGMVTTIVFILTVNNVASSRHGLVLTALAEMIAGGISMALGGYLSIKTQHEVTDRQIATERHEILHEPAEERAELRAAYRRKGFTGLLLEQVVAHQTATPERWLRAMVRDELGLVGDEREHPIVQGALVGGAFMVGALVPIVPFLTPLSNPIPWSFVTTVLASIVIGVIKSRYTLRGPVRSAAELLVVISLGALAGWLIGLLLAH